ncbi:4Fe-4S binding protein [Desulfopila sp. IMCC35006]|uniref:4Fe-4S binding protein n=1 Tax=Desulfopila sp. IMCC35006 TaxID=2569542 RepID=UPI0010ACA06D|nr:4Fe-4S binding protein [Desulfopila sp. IMCC35006]TKB27170.1 4Fe-4S binding protein [Desulfopila sp. IMCC35006]
MVLRRCTQLLFLAVFLYLFIKTDYNGSDRLDAAVNILFRLDPFLAAAVMLAAKTFVALFLPALAVVVLTFFVGRAFCGWFCPMGTLLDLCQKFIPATWRKSRTFFPDLALIILIFTLVSALFGFGIAGYFDPFSILVRGLAQALYPAFNNLTVGFFTYTYQELPVVNGFTEPVYSFLRATVLPSSQKFFQLAYFSLFVLLTVLLLEAVQRRFFCRNLCPLGALLGLIGRSGTFAAKGGNDDCRACRICSSNCRMGAIDDDRKIDMGSCTLCYECVEKCPRQIIGFDFALIGRKNSRPSLSRRKFIGAALLGFLLPSVKGVAVQAKNPDPLLIRPPGALAEKEFLQRCVRCAECIQVCLGNALQPSLFQAGLDGMFSPMLVARSGYCEFNCTLCGQVCPTGAIRQLTTVEKHQWKIGHAWFDKNICLPYARATACMVCEEHCPTPDKAIRFKEVVVAGTDGQAITIGQPYVVEELCIGCGICETKCPLPGRSAIFITSAGEHRHPDNALTSYGGYN